jgi:hypothetical protein
MRYQHFLKIGLTAIILINSANLNAKETNPIQHNLTHIVDSTSTKEKSSVVAHKIEEKKESITFGKILKYTAFSALGIAGLGAGWITYILFGMVNAGKDIKRNPKQQANHDFLEACGEGNLNKIKYLLNEKSANIHSEKDLGIQRACASNHLEIVKYLLTSPELKKHSNIHANDDYSFKSACRNNNMDTIQYLIFEYRIPKNRSIKEFLKENNEISQMFDKRDLNEQLHQEIKGSETTKKRNKL